MYRREGQASRGEPDEPWKGVLYVIQCMCKGVGVGSRWRANWTISSQVASRGHLPKVRGIMISRIVVEGFKSIRDEVDVEFAPLTILAGANSSGKSSLMQPLLLLKQTFEASYDPGPLLIAGPNVTFSQVDQMFWSAPGQERLDQFRIGLYRPTDPETGVEVLFKKSEDGGLPLQIARCTWTLEDREHVLSPDMSSEELEGYFPEDILERLAEVSEEDEELQLNRSTRRMGSLLLADLEVSGLGRVATFPRVWMTTVRDLHGIIHVGPLRGNPVRTYPVTAVGSRFSGPFHKYVASVIASWQTERARKLLKTLGDDLRELGLTWKARTRKVNDAAVKIEVGRLPIPKRGGARDVVSIADVGFGVSQALPVAVALLAASPGQTVYVEQPEIHLHPRAQVALANLLIRAVKRGVQVIAETHSELLLLGIQRLVAEGSLPSSEVKLHWFKRDEEGVTHVESADLDEQGAFGDWPVDFAEESMKAMRDYLQATQPPAQRKIEWPTA